MRFRSAGGLFFFFLSGCFGSCVNPSCNLDFSECRDDLDCGGSDICEAGICEDRRACDDGCFAGETCVQRPGRPSDNPFSSPTPGKQVCECTSVLGCDEFGGDGGFAGSGGFTGSGGFAGSGGSTGTGDGGSASCAVLAPDIDALSRVGGAGTETGPLFAPQKAAMAIGFEGTLVELDPPLASSGDSDVMVVGSADGSTVDWVRSIGNESRNVPTALAASSKGVIVATPFKGTLDTGDGVLLESGLSTAAAVLALSPTDGATQWSQVVRADGDVTITGVAWSGVGGGGVIVAGSYSGELDLGDVKLPGAGELDAFVAAFDLVTHGTKWFHTFGGTGEETITAVASSFGDVILAGSFDADLAVDTAPLAVADGQDAFVVHVQQSGLLHWKKVIGGPDSQAVTAITPFSNGALIAGTRGGVGSMPGDIYFDGGLTLAGDGLIDGFVARVDKDGDVLSGTLIPAAPGTGVVIPTAIDTDCESNILVAGTADDGAQLGEYILSGSGGRDAFLLKLGSSWTPLWTLPLGTPGDDSVTALSIRYDGTLHAGGSFSGSGGTLGLTSAGGEDAFFLEVKP